MAAAAARDDARRALLAGLPVQEVTIHPAGVPTAVLTGGDGPPVILLHGPGEFALNWAAVIPTLARQYRIIAPDLPGHGASGTGSGLTPDSVLHWLDELITALCPTPPVIVGRVVGGAIGARYAIQHSDRIRHLVLVDTLGLAPFTPAPRFEAAMNRFLRAPSARTYDRFMQLCAYDLDTVQGRLDERWQPLETYAVELARTPSVLAAMGTLLGIFGLQPIPAEELDRITAPTTLVWGRHDMATALSVAQVASDRHNWPLHVIEDAADDPPLETPEQFARVLTAILTANETAEMAR